LVAVDAQHNLTDQGKVKKLKPMTLIYDGDCAFCYRCVQWGARNLKVWPTAVAYQSIDANVYGLNQQQVQRSIWLLPQKLPANRAVADILKQQPDVAWRIIGALMDLPLLRVASKAGYYFVARNRHRLPGATEACELPTSDLPASELPANK
jgi:predicted DCC family thiol-disulfide oxidoreductase YuxK